MRKLIIEGSLLKDAEIRSDKNGKEYSLFTVLTGNNEWITVLAYGDLAEEYKQNTKVHIEGIPSVSVYVNKDNKPTAKLSMFAKSIQFMANIQLLVEDTPF